MCCDEAVKAEEAKPEEGGPMAKVYTVDPGAVVQIQGYGPASNDVPAIVPAEVAAEFADSPQFRVEEEDDEDGPSKGGRRRRKAEEE